MAFLSQEGKATERTTFEGMFRKQPRNHKSSVFSLCFGGRLEDRVEYDNSNLGRFSINSLAETERTAENFSTRGFVVYTKTGDEAAEVIVLLGPIPDAAQSFCIVIGYQQNGDPFATVSEFRFETVTTLQAQVLQPRQWSFFQD